MFGWDRFESRVKQGEREWRLSSLGKGRNGNAGRAAGEGVEDEERSHGCDRWWTDIAMEMKEERGR